jgi:hypothetical protein
MNECGASLQGTQRKILEVSISVGEILRRTGDAYPAASPFPIGASLMQVTLSPQQAADLLFYLMSAMSTVSASTTTHSTKTIYSFIEEGLMLDMALEQQTNLKSAIETAISEATPRKSGIRNNTKSKSKRSKFSVRQFPFGQRRED